MKNPKKPHSETKQFEIKVLPDKEWDERLSSLKKSGEQKAKELRQKGHRFYLDVLAPGSVKTCDEVSMASVEIPLDWKIEQRMELVGLAKNLIDKAYLLNCFDQALPTILKSIIENGGVYEYNIGEFLELYGKFVQKYNLEEGTPVRKKMAELISGDAKYLRSYVHFSKMQTVPLPYAIRNIIAHKNNPNKFEESELQTAISLLRSWLSL